MQVPTFVKLLGGCTAVYVILAACGSSGGSGGGLVDGGTWFDALTDPVPESSAAPPLVVEAPCTTVVSTYTFAEAAFPGKSVEELARVAVAGELTTPSPNLTFPAGYTHAGAVGPVFLRPGSVATYCGAQGVTTFTKVRFILPQ